MKSRAEMCHEECLEYPIFLLQERYYIYSDLEGSEFDFHEELDGIYRRDDLEKYTDDDYMLLKPVDPAEIVSYELAQEMWRTEMIFLTREEGEKYIKRKHYHYKYGARIYSVPASKLLGEFLYKHWDCEGNNG